MFDWFRNGALRRARKAARSGRWGEAAVSYQAHLRRVPGDGAAWLQLGHALKEIGQRDAAQAAYEQATRLIPSRSASWIELANLQRAQGRAMQAITTLRAGSFAAASPDGNGLPDAALVDALLGLGARNYLPLPVHAAIEASDGIYALSRYAQFRRAYQTRVLAPMRARAMGRAAGLVTVVIDGRGAHLDLVSITVDSLDGLPCLVISDNTTPVSLPTDDVDRAFLLIKAGMRICEATIPCMRAALHRSEVSMVYCDHDHWDWVQDATTAHNPAPGILYFAPCLHPMYDPFWFAQAMHAPVCCLLAASFVSGFARWADVIEALPGQLHRSAHLPLLLVSVFAGTGTSEPQPIPSAEHTDYGVGEPAGIQVVVQTRDAPDLLAACITSLLDTANRPGLLDIVIVDNRSTLPATAKILEEWSRRGVIRVITHDEAFNWARANNLAVRQGVQPYLLFLNNDVAMRTEGWDDKLRHYLANAADAGSVGLVGACLLYPDERIQHAGVVIGMKDAGPVHEGVGMLLDEKRAYAPPLDRWANPRLVAAVTGAWMATTRSLFEAVGGFDERLPVAFNDIDFCLRSRSVGRCVLYAADIVAVHRESATRGVTTSVAQMQHEQAEWQWLRGLWGKALQDDPAYNPNWTRVGQPCDGFVLPTIKEVEAWTMASARAQPWSLVADSTA